MKNKKILVIEDNELNMKLARSVLQIGNYKILEAEKAEDGIALAREHHPDLILMDIHLPGMDGLTATRIMKEDADLAMIPVVAVTGHAVGINEAKAREAGCVGYISKPYSVKAMLKEVAHYIQHSGSK